MQSRPLQENPPELCSSWTSVNNRMTSSKLVREHTLFEENKTLEDELALRWRGGGVGVEYDHSGASSLSSNILLTNAEDCGDIG